MTLYQVKVKDTFYEDASDHQFRVIGLEASSEEDLKEKLEAMAPRYRWVWYQLAIS